MLTVSLPLSKLSLRFLQLLSIDVCCCCLPFHIGPLGKKHQHAEAVPETEPSQNKSSELRDEPQHLLPTRRRHDY